jgi:anaerobic ribonucleoside-triphosphate reductase activating protein
MKIASTQYSLSTQSFEIYLSGCDGFCKGCHNPELQDYRIGEDYKKVLPSIITKVNEFNSLVKNVFIMGGEPLQQKLDLLLDLILNIKQNTNCKIWLWTRATIDNVPELIKEQCDYIKTGYYDEKLKCDDNIQYGIKLATSNQKIYKMEEFNEHTNKIL